MVEWVERGVARERIIATKYIEDNKAKPPRAPCAQTQP